MLLLIGYPEGVLRDHKTSYKNHDDWILHTKIIHLKEEKYQNAVLTSMY